MCRRITHGRCGQTSVTKTDPAASIPAERTSRVMTNTLAGGSPDGRRARINVTRMRLLPHPSAGSVSHPARNLEVNDKTSRAVTDTVAGGSPDGRRARRRGARGWRRGGPGAAAVGKGTTCHPAASAHPKNAAPAAAPKPPAHHPSAAAHRRLGFRVQWVGSQSDARNPPPTTRLRPPTGG